MNPADILLLFAQIALLVLTAAVLGKIAETFGLPKITGELAAGILLGPTFMGHFWPETSNFFFPANQAIVDIRSRIVHTGLLFFLLAAGMELQFEYLKKNIRTVAFCSLFGIIIPFALGWALVIAFPDIIGARPENQRFLAFFLGTALSISALPVIAKILIDLKLMQTRFGTLVMSAAAVDDLAGWILFYALLTRFQGSMHSAAELAGMHSVFGSFVMGVFLSGSARIWKTFHSKLIYAVSHFFAPLFFASIGLKMNFMLHLDPLLIFWVFLIACIGKIAGVTAGAYLSKLPWRESLALGFAMNARGAMGMVLAATALKYGMIRENLFTALILMALGTSIMSAPAVKALLLSGKSKS